MRSIIGLFAIAALLVGAYVALQFGAGLEKFGGLEYLARVAALSIVGYFGSKLATWCALLVSVRELHETGSLRRGVAASAIAVVGYPIACCLSFVGSLLAFRAFFGTDLRAYVTDARETVGASEIGRALAYCAICALIIAAGLVVGRDFWTSTRFTGGRKLAVAAGGFVLIQWALSIFLVPLLVGRS